MKMLDQIYHASIVSVNRDVYFADSSLHLSLSSSMSYSLPLNDTNIDGMQYSDDFDIDETVVEEMKLESDIHSESDGDVEEMEKTLMRSNNFRVRDRVGLLDIAVQGLVQWEHFEEAAFGRPGVDFSDLGCYVTFSLPNPSSFESDAVVSSGLESRGESKIATLWLDSGYPLLNGRCRTRYDLPEGIDLWHFFRTHAADTFGPASDTLLHLQLRHCDDEGGISSPTDKVFAETHVMLADLERFLRGDGGYATLSLPLHCPFGRFVNPLATVSISFTYIIEPSLSPQIDNPSVSSPTRTSQVFQNPSHYKSETKFESVHPDSAPALFPNLMSLLRNSTSSADGKFVHFPDTAPTRPTIAEVESNVPPAERRHDELLCVTILQFTHISHPLLKDSNSRHNCHPHLFCVAELQPSESHKFSKTATSLKPLAPSIEWPTNSKRLLVRRQIDSSLLVTILLRDIYPESIGAEDLLSFSDARATDFFLGSAAVDLKPLLSLGFPSISGWYNVTDKAQTLRGYLQVEVRPSTGSGNLPEPLLSEAHLKYCVDSEFSEENPFTELAQLHRTLTELDRSLMQTQFIPKAESTTVNYLTNSCEFDMSHLKLTHTSMVEPQMSKSPAAFADVQTLSATVVEPTLYATDAQPFDLTELIAQQSASPSVDQLRSLMLECLTHLQGLSSPAPVSVEGNTLPAECLTNGLEDSFDCDYSTSSAPTSQQADNDGFNAEFVIDELTIEGLCDEDFDGNEEDVDADDDDEACDNNNQDDNSIDIATEIAVEELDELETGFADDITDSIAQLDILTTSQMTDDGPRAGRIELDVNDSSDGSNYDSLDRSLDNDTNDFPEKVEAVIEPELATVESLDCERLQNLSSEVADAVMPATLSMPVPDISKLVRSVLRRKSLRDASKTAWSQQRQRRFVDTEIDRVSQIMLSKLG